MPWQPRRFQSPDAPLLAPEAERTRIVLVGEQPPIRRESAAVSFKTRFGKWQRSVVCAGKCPDTDLACLRASDETIIVLGRDGRDHTTLVSDYTTDSFACLHAPRDTGIPAGD